MTIRDSKHDNWTQVTDNTFNVSDALLFDSISIIVKVPGLKLEVKDVTLGDAGYFNGGVDENAATSGGGVVLIVYDKPKKPEIKGNRSVPINTSSELTCSSQSTAAPDYYSKLATLSYTWFVNEKKMDGETNQTLRLKVTRGHKYNNYSCKATEDGLESDWSDTVQIEPLYGPDKITITPHPNTSMQDNGMVTVREGETFGPYHCLVDCSPPCNVTWTYMNSTGHLDVISPNRSLSFEQINKDIKLFQCVATWGTETKKEKNITLNVQYLGEPLILINNNHSSDTNMDLQENIPFNVSCLVDGNPIPNVRLTKGSENISTNSASKNTKWANHTFVSAGCADAGNYTCVGSSEGFNISEKTFRINILYGPDKITITPHPNTSMQDNGMVTVREGETFGPYQCLVDCHPPCNVTWTYMNSTGHLHVISPNRSLSFEQINKDIKLFQCVATWGTETKKEKNITLNVQYLGEPLILINNNHSSDTNMDLQENIPFNVSCLVDGNPIPNVRLTKGSENISTNSASKNTKWANHTFVSAGCADAGNYTCVGSSEGFNISEKTFRINILYGPDKITITPHPNTSMQDNGMVTVREGETFGPYQCLVDCHPPCNVTWTNMNSTGHLHVISTNRSLSSEQINKDIKLFQCVATWGTETKKEKNITLNVQYLGEPLILINNNHSSDTNMDLQENIPFNVSCLVDGNPIPNVRLTKGSENISTNSASKNTKWANHTFVSAGCADAGNYTCVGSSEGFNISEKTFRINILCNVRIDDSIFYHKKYGSPSGMNVRVASVIPVIANPFPQLPAIKWVGPETEQIQFNVFGRGVAYKHWINTSFPVYNHSYFGNYTMIYGDETLLTITISERDRPRTPQNFTWHSYAGGHINLTWVSGFNGGLEQYFVVSLEKDKWETVANVSDPGEGSVVYFNPGFLAPGQKYRYRLESCNTINCSIVSPEVTINVEVEDITTVSHLETNRVEHLYVIIGASVAVVGLIVILVVALVISFRRRKNKEKDEGDNNTTSGGEMYATVDKSRQKPKADVVKDDVTKKQNDTTSGGEMYATVDKSRQKPKAEVVKDDVTKKQNEEAPGTEMYAVVDKNLKRNKRGDVGEMSNKAGQSKLLTKETAGEKRKQRNNAANQSVEERNLSTEDAARACKTNNEGLVYIEVDFTNQSKRSKTNQAPVIHGEDNRTEYTFVDFSKKAPPITDADDKEENQEES
ncbi:hemicentin-1-like [Crassostrea angulata]|uniref:hemicentin-1-like n=1 Tax=Magallana angulata TaxID=2784310 RepID=UPI0022B15C3D|nr:hemicentin-1-like [Crassostrea angulata]